MKSLKLIGCETYTYRGQQYRRNQVVMVSGDMADYLSEVSDDYGRKYFETVSEGPSGASTTKATATAKAAGGPPKNYLTKLDHKKRRMYDDDGNKIKPKERDAFMALAHLASLSGEDQAELDFEGDSLPDELDDGTDDDTGEVTVPI